MKRFRDRFTNVEIDLILERGEADNATETEKNLVHALIYEEILTHVRLKFVYDDAGFPNGVANDDGTPERITKINWRALFRAHNAGSPVLAVLEDDFRGQTV